MLFSALVGSILAVFVILEIAIRCLKPGTTPENNRERPSVYYLPARADTGRGNVFDEKTTAGTHRICVVGDSFTFGPKLHYYDTFSARLQTLFNLSGQAVKFEVINFGTPGFSTWHEVEVVSSALKMGCHLILLEITLNDAQEAPLGHNPLVARSAKEGVLGYSKIAQWVWGRIESFLSVQRYIDYHYHLFQDPRTGDVFRRSLRSMKEAVDKQGAKLLAVVFPLFDFPIDDRYPFRALHQEIEQSLTGENIPFLDLQRAYRGVDIKRIQLIPGRDSHPNEIGHRIAADAIYRWLRRRHELPEEAFGGRELSERESVR